MPRPSRRAATLTLTAALALTAPLATPAAAAPAAADATYPEILSLRPGSQPEGIAKGPGTTYFAGARSDGAIYVGDVSDGTRNRLVQGREGGAARGLMLDEASGLLWVAGDEREVSDPEAPTTSTIRAYDSRTGALVREVVVPGQRFLNDVMITDDAVYVTDSLNPELVVVTPEGYFLLPLTGDFEQPAGFGANGIRDLPGGNLLITAGGDLYKVRPTNGVAYRIELSGPDLTSGDGLERDGRTVYVVYGFSRDSVAVVELGRGSRSGSVTGELGKRDRLDRPTTAVLVDGDLYAVNGRFAVPPTPETRYWVTRISVPE